MDNKNTILLLLLFTLIVVSFSAPLFVSTSQFENKQLENQEDHNPPTASSHSPLRSEWAPHFKTEFSTIQNNTLIGISSGQTDLEPEIRIVITTAYSSTPDQTDDDPFITASGSYTRDGVIAANFLPFGTKVKFPTLYKDKIFIVEDRMKNNHQVDIWFPTREQALEFGVKRLPILILENN